MAARFRRASPHDADALRALIVRSMGHASEAVGFFERRVAAYATSR